MKSFRLAVLVLAFMAAAFAPALGQSPMPRLMPFAGQSIVLIEPAGEGTVTHIVAALLRPGLEQALDAKVTVETVPSPETVQAFDRLFEAKPDGRTLLVMSDAARQFYEYLSRPRRIMDMLTPVAKLTDGVSLTLAATAQSPLKTYALLKEALKSSRAPVLAINGNASPSGVFAAMVEDDGGGRFTERLFDIDFRIDDSLRAGKAELGILPTPALFRPSGKDNELQALLTSGARRHPRLPDVPTLAEVTGKKKLAFTAAIGLYAPPNTPVELSEPITRAAVAAAALPAAKEAAEKASIPLHVQNSIVLRESTARAKRVINDLLNN
jgi:tripartite-type tricarboxylate transporter receptor subunit TctC